MPRRILLALLSLFFVTPPSAAQDVRIGVLEIFRPRVLQLHSANQEAIVLRAGRKTAVIEPWTRTFAEIRMTQGGLRIAFRGQTWDAALLTATARDGSAARFVLVIPGKMRRMYRGTFRVQAQNGVLSPVVQMDLETAVASVVAAESDAGAPLEALKAQAIVTRSYFFAGAKRHASFDFCDLTHCQFLREPPGPATPAALAAQATRGLVLSYEEKIFAAMFTRSCGGTTRTPAEIGLPGDEYPYFPVPCEACYTSPRRWKRSLSLADAEELMKKGEAGRLEITRRLGWDAVPSNNFITHREKEGVALEGAGEGHGVGLCQRGARQMAASGALYPDILQHYFPNTRVRSLPSRP